MSKKPVPRGKKDSASDPDKPVQVITVVKVSDTKLKVKNAGESKSTPKESKPLDKPLQSKKDSVSGPTPPVFTVVKVSDTKLTVKNGGDSQQPTMKISKRFKKPQQSKEEPVSSENPKPVVSAVKVSDTKLGTENKESESQPSRTESRSIEKTQESKKEPVSETDQENKKENKREESAPIEPVVKVSDTKPAVEKKEEQREEPQPFQKDPQSIDKPTESEKEPVSVDAPPAPVVKVPDTKLAAENEGEPQTPQKMSKRFRKPLQNKRETVSESDSITSSVGPGKNRSLDSTTEQPSYLLRVKVPDITKLDKDNKEESDPASHKISKRFNRKPLLRKEETTSESASEAPAVKVSDTKLEVEDGRGSETQPSPKQTKRFRKPVQNKKEPVTESVSSPALALRKKEPATPTADASPAISPSISPGLSPAVSLAGIFTKKPKDAGDIITDLITETPISLPGLSGSYTGDESPEAAEIQHLTQQLLDYEVKRDWINYAKLCHPSITGFEPQGHGHMIKGLEFQRFYFETTTSATPHKTLIMDPQVTMLGPESAVIAYVRICQKADTATNSIYSIHSNESRVWKRIGGAWLNIHYHKSNTSKVVSP